MSHQSSTMPPHKSPSNCRSSDWRIRMNEPAGLVKLGRCLAYHSSLLRGSPLSPIVRMFWIGSLTMPAP
jgi:hypothetical protein